jgi:hypothetical protein
MPLEVDIGERFALHDGDRTLLRVDPRWVNCVAVAESVAQLIPAFLEWGHPV